MNLTDFTYDSDEEIYFSQWLIELQKVGLVDSWTRDVATIEITQGLTNYYTEQIRLKTKIKQTEKKQYLLRSSDYTPDFLIKWNGRAEGKLFQSIYCATKITAPFIGENCMSTVEVKSSFDYQNMSRLFVNNQKFIWDKFKIFINLIKIEDLFDQTFTPQARLYGKKGKERKITKWQPRSIDEFMKAL